MSGYVFFANSIKPTKDQAESKEPFSPTNYSRPSLKAALDLGYDVYMGIGRPNAREIKCDLPIKLYDAHTYRSVVALRDNRIAYKNLCRIIKDANVEVIHCNTPVGGMIGRICGKKCKVKKVIYTVHGFHFYKGAPKLNWLLYYSIEKLFARWTDAIITINEEDFEVAKKFKLRKNGKVYLVHGVGINTEEYFSLEVDRDSVRKELGLSDSDFALISVGELNENKNNKVIIEALGKINNPNIHYFLCGEGPLKEELKKTATEKGIEAQVHFLGYRKDVSKLYKSMDLFAMPSLREGLSRSLMEAMSAGLPCVASKIRGNVDLIEDGVGGYLCGTNDSDAYAEKINLLANDSELHKKMSESNLKTIKPFDVKNVEKEIKSIYAEVLSE